MSRTIDKARKNKNDEFYTLYSEIEKELKYYKNAFNNKVVYCNCDDYRYSNFYKYFKNNFNELHLKKLISTSYNSNGNGIYAAYDGLNEEVNTLNSNGSYDSEECIKILDEADIVVTNPPFSKIKYLVPMLLEKNKQILILGTINCLSYKEIFKYIFHQKLWTGVNKNVMEFQVSEEYEFTNKSNSRVDEQGNKYVKLPCIRWLTNIKHDIEQKDIILTKTYNENDYLKYDNYDAINVNKLKDIPSDYDEVIGVPITILDYIKDDGLIHLYTEEYEVVGCPDAAEVPEDWKGFTKEAVEDYYKQGGTGQYCEGKLLSYYYDEENKIKIPFKRVLIKKNDEQYQVEGLFNNFKESNNFLKIGEEKIIYYTPDINKEHPKKFVGPVVNGDGIYLRVLIKKKELTFKPVSMFNNYRDENEFIKIGSLLDFSYISPKIKRWRGPAINNKPLYNRVLIKKNII